MTLPVVERIARVIETRLKTISDIRGVYRPIKAGEIKPVDRMIVLFQGLPVRNEELSVGGATRIVAWDQLFAIILYVRPSDKSTVAIETSINQFAAEADAAISSATDWHNMKEAITNPPALAVNSKWESPDPFPDQDEAFDGIQLNLSVTYRIAEGDPYTPKA